MQILSRSAPLKAAGGFTLVELMVTLAVFAVLALYAVPNFTAVINNNRLTTAANEIIGALNTARMEAIKRNGYTQFCSNSGTSNGSDTLGTACGAVSPGSVVVQLTPTTTAPVFDAPPQLAAPVQLSGSIAAIRFHGDGLGYAPGSTSPYSDTSTTQVVDICTAALKTNNHIQVQMAMGSIITTKTSTRTCP